VFVESGLLLKAAVAGSGRCFTSTFNSLAFSWYRIHNQMPTAAIQAANITNESLNTNFTFFAIQNLYYSGIIVFPLAFNLPFMLPG
jgi:hypothetical protein